LENFAGQSYCFNRAGHHRQQYCHEAVFKDIMVMKILLTKDVQGLGRAGDVKEVSDGYARNFLLPRHFGLPATSSVLAKVQKEEQEHQAKVAKQQEVFEQLKQRLVTKTFTIKAKAEKNTLFAAVKESQIAAAIKDKLTLEISPDQIIIKSPIKTLGKHEAEIRFAGNAKTIIQLDVRAL
jgi:large subunit ribosomal protein L9